MMQVYRGIARAAWRNALAYRLPIVLSLSMLVFNLIAMLALWRVLIDSNGNLAGFTWPQMKAYLLVTFVTNCLVSSFSDFTMAHRIQSGMVAMDLTKPVDYQKARLAQCVGLTGLEMITATVVCTAALLVFGGVPLPPPGQLALFAVSFVAVVPLKFLIVYMAGLLCFWTQNYLGVFFARVAVSAILSGALVPLAFFPHWLQMTAAVLPFQATVSTPALLFLGRASGTDAVVLLAVQLFWIAVLWLAGRLAWRAALRRLTVHGG
jgi:ABC-2 type transport system permease protein